MAEDAPWKGLLSINIISGKSLMVGDLTSSDPYTICTVHHTATGENICRRVGNYKTRVVQRSLNPEWKEVFELPVDLPPGVLHIRFKVWDRDVGRKSDFLGRATLDLKRNSDQLGKNDITLLLEARPGKKDKIKSGQIHVSVNLDPNATPKTSNQYAIYEHLTTGLARTLSSNEKPRVYSTYRIQMFNVETTFGDKKQGWNQKYDAAQKIFGDSVSSSTLRTTIRLQHNNLYGSPSSKGIIKSGEQFPALVNNGILGQKPRFFTYALMDRELFFSETGAAFFSDFTSKHAMHACVNEHVRYAGEFHFSKTDKGTYKLVIDNNSGTFGPDPNDLPRLQRIFQLNFPGLEVDVRDFKDPLLKKVKDEFDNSPFIK